VGYDVKDTRRELANMLKGGAARSIQPGSGVMTWAAALLRRLEWFAQYSYATTGQQLATV
jgi:hypothetical protein